MRGIALLFIVLLLSTSCKPTSEGSRAASLQELQAKPAAFDENEVENEWIRTKIDSAMKANNIPAISIGVIRNGKLSYVEGFGEKERGSTSKVTERTVYQIGSDTKKLTGILANNLISEGKLRAEESIVTYLPDALTSEAKEKLNAITVQHLLLHRSGLPYRAPGNKRIDGEPMLVPYTEQDLLKDLNELQLESEPGSDFGYSNFGYAVVGYILEQASGQSYGALLKKYIADRYDLENTFVAPDAAQMELIATPYRKDDRNRKTSLFVMGKLTSAGGVYSNVEDVSKLMLAQMQAYRLFSQKGDKNNPLILTESDGIEGSHYGYGLNKTVDKGTTRYGHGGDMDGFASGYVFYPELNKGLILLTSSGGRWFGQLEGELRRKLFEQDNL
ncbi:serine hydrolase domain-containing protein [Pontibacter kalidii]|uniref:serine hydrolase domain-containing protein n=1 Tax=Pontibacter kalidii TaxID=2592049 RepID=UPI0022547AB0|nr:serine hydrolase domain-containing protein [Pontibacter kalidii]